jgi:hypothetical protein
VIDYADDDCANRSPGLRIAHLSGTASLIQHKHAIADACPHRIHGDIVFRSDLIGKVQSLDDEEFPADKERMLDSSNNRAGDLPDIHGLSHVHFVHDPHHRVINRHERLGKGQRSLSAANDEHQFAWAGLGGGIRSHHRLAGRMLPAVQRLNDEQLYALQSDVFMLGDYLADDSSEIHAVPSMCSERSPDVFSHRCARSVSEWEGRYDRISVGLEQFDDLSDQHNQCHGNRDVLSGGRFVPQMIGWQSCVCGRLFALTLSRLGNCPGGSAAEHGARCGADQDDA